ncbi:uncharacterized protein LOC112541209 [Python bivittatus]|uniref:Uncharacterized protein LOC112541209 n=1 Tax=Python bivittatus TaxID=176946 RepID=A0A9F5IXE9_PYTBI|nr:uncharacterized protein LOC112541209 [Python bivittatus]XP_025025406.1 uncharacterized protein LOC112541209 [Python bivittatus]
MLRPEQRSWRGPRVSPPGMGSQLLWGLAAACALVAVAELPGGAEGTEAPGQTQGDLSEGDTGALRTTRTTQHQKKPWRPYRAGSLSALSRGLVKTTGTSREEGEGSAHRQARGAGARRAPRLGHSGAALPNHMASREIKCVTKRGKRLVDSSGFVSPPAKCHPQAGFFSGTRSGRRHEADVPHGRCQGCGKTAYTAGFFLGKKGEGTRVSRL